MLCPPIANTDVSPARMPAGVVSIVNPGLNTDVENIPIPSVLPDPLTRSKSFARAMFNAVSSSTLASEASRLLTYLVLTVFLIQILPVSVINQ